ncbi:MAG: ABC transporter ATP-binding protein [Nitrospiria bacterium]
MKDPVIVFENVFKSYPMYHHVTGGIKNFIFNFPGSLKSLRKHRFEALRDISLTVYKGETFGLIGRNGAGKSTTLGLIAGVLRPTKGRVIIRGRVSPLLELGAGFHNDLTGRENIVLNGVLMGLTRASVLRKADEIVEFSELGDFIDQPIRVYSSGMLARLGFSIIANLEPDILLVDEVLAVGDISFQKKCVDKMAEFKKDGVTIIFVSHAISGLESICDRVAWIENHSIRRLGNPKEILSEYTRDFQ